MREQQRYQMVSLRPYDFLEKFVGEWDSGTYTIFNLAMIAKQGWNIMKKPHTLVAQIYKARYFPKSSLFDAQLGHNPSYAWRGIWKSCHILMNGYRWIVENGTKIKVMSEPWLREKDGAWIQSLIHHKFKVRIT
jgi:hypothetical protein